MDRLPVLLCWAPIGGPPHWEDKLVLRGPSEGKKINSHWKEMIPKGKRRDKSELDASRQEEASQDERQERRVPQETGAEEGY